MNEIVVLSGKGGTGKTSITAALAVLAGNDAVIADCDVDAANMHLLLRPDFGKTEEFFSGELAEINQDLCTLCRKCAEVCRFNAVPFLNNQFKIDNLNCEGCGYCEKACPTQAILMKTRKSGHVYISETKAGNTMVHARLDIGAENSGKLIAKVKNEAKSLATVTHKNFIIVDGSPGIGCPVVSSLAGANYVILVTEPTLSGLHDLKRVYSVIKKFRIKAGCIINKCDLNPEKTAEIKDFLKLEEINHLADIGYDVNFSKAMVEGKTIVEIQSPLKPLLENIWEKLKKHFNNKIKMEKIVFGPVPSRRLGKSIGINNIPTRPPAFEGTLPPDETAVASAWEIFNQQGLSVELLTGYEGNAFASSGNFADDLLSITAVHPMRKDAVMELMAKANASEENLDDLIKNGLIKKLSFNDQEYYLRKFKKV